MTVDDLAETLRDTITAVISLARDRGISQLPATKYTVTWWQATDDPTRSSGMREDREELCPLGLWIEVSEHHAYSEAVRSYCDGVHRFSGMHGKWIPAFGAENSISLQPRLLFVEYFNRVGALRLDENVVTTICNDFLREIESDTIKALVVFRVENFDAPMPIRLESGTTLRPITENEIDRYSRLSWLGMSLSDDDWISSGDWVCEILRDVPKQPMGAFNALPGEIEDVAAAVALTSPGRVIFKEIHTGLAQPFVCFFFGRGGHPVMTSRSGGTVSLSADDVLRLQATYQAVRDVSTNDQLAALRLPIRRLRLSGERPNDEDRLVDCVIALENLLAPDSPALETTYRIALRGAAILPDDFGTPSLRMKLLKGLYEFRSKVVHGSKTARGGGKVRPNSVVDAEQAENVLRSVLGWYLTQCPIPTPDTVAKRLDDAMVTGGASHARPTRIVDS